MFKKLNRFARKVAAIDERSIKASTKSDRIWATQIGYMLMLTFMVLFSITYFSVDYFNSSDIVFDSQTHTMQMRNADKNIWLVLGGIGIATVIASIIFMFDRAVFQSDWFAQTPYGIPQSWGSRLGGALGKLLRISVRLGISMAIAYALSTFLELRMYSAQIEEVMQYDNMKKNATIYNDIKQYAVDTDKQIKATKKEKKELQHRLTLLRSGEAPWVLDKGMARMREEHQKGQQRSRQNLTEIKRQEKVETIPMKQELSSLMQRHDELLKKIEISEMEQKAEEYGLDGLKIEGMVLKTSGKRGDGIRSKMLKKRLRQLKERLSKLSKSIRISKSALRKVQASYRRRETQISNMYMANEREYKQKKNSYETDIKAKYKRELQSKISSTEARLGAITAELEKQINQRDERVGNHTQAMLHSPQFIPFHDGPLVRMSALHKLSTQGENAEEIRMFSWIVKAFLIFLEVVPVVAKMFFAPPSVYAAMLQMQAKNRIRRIVDDEDGASMYELDEQIALEKKRIKLNHLRNQRIISDELNRRDIREHMKERNFEKNINKDVA